jgi:hypothetical protein
MQQEQQQQEQQLEQRAEAVRGWGGDVLSEEEEEEEGKGGREEGEEGGGGLKYPIQPKSASMPFMITRDMRRALIEDMNYSRKEVDGMKPEYALDLIERGIKKPPKPRRVAPYPPAEFVPVLDRGEEEKEGGREEEGGVIEVRSSSSAAA